jgi:hypothetical protein
MLIFLDIDGVMVPAKGWARPELMRDGFAMFSSNATQALQQIVGESDTVILTTSHKESYTHTEWLSLLSTRNIKVNKLKILPANTERLTRREEIERWCNLNPITEDVVILDDDSSLQNLPAYLKDRWIQTMPTIGLTTEHLSRFGELKAQKMELA